MVDARHEYAVVLVPAAGDLKGERLVAARARQRELSLVRLGRQGYGEHAQLDEHLLGGERVLEAFGELEELEARLEVVEVVADPLEHDAIDLGAHGRRRVEPVEQALGHVQRRRLIVVVVVVVVVVVA